MFPELIIMEKLKYVQPWVKDLFSGNIPAVPSPGRLKNFIINWGTLTQDQSNLSIVEVYKIQFQRSPVQQKKPMESYFSQSQQQQISEEIQEMLEKGAVHKIIQNRSSNLGFLINLFLVDKKDWGNHLGVKSI